jgi:type I restriction enzyme S subunit
MERIKQLLLPVPKYDEQMAIAEYIDFRSIQINGVLDTINSQVDKLKELRKALINDVVTGKLRVA